MKIVNKKEFYELPEGTLYSNYVRCSFSSLNVKQSTSYKESIPIDFIYESLIGNVDFSDLSYCDDVLLEAEKNKTSLPLDFECGERDGMYLEDELFAIYEKQDLEDFIKKLESLRSAFVTIDNWKYNDNGLATLL